MKPCLKPCRSPPPVLCTHRKCVAFGAQISEEVHIADEWDRTPTEPTRKLTYQDLLELKAIQRSLPHANQPCDLMGGRQFLSQVPMALVPLLPNQPEPVQCKLMQMHLPLLDTPPSSGSSSPYSASSRTSTPSLSNTSLDSSPHSSPDSHRFLPLLLDDPDPHPLFRTGTACRKPKKKKFIIVNDIEMEMDDSDSDSESDLDHLGCKRGDVLPSQSTPKRSATPTPPPTPTEEDDLDLDPQNSILFSQVSMSNAPPRSCDTRYPQLPTPPSSISSSESNSFPCFPYPPGPRPHLTTPCRDNSSPLSPPTPTSLSPKPRSPTTAPINLHIPMRFKRSGSGSCLSPCSNSSAVATPALSRVRGV